MATTMPIATHHIVGSSFGFFTADEIRRLSVKRIDNPVSLSRLMTPIEGGLYDPAMGPLDRDTKCVTCGMMEMNCPGHFGHIELPVPVYNPLIFAELLTLIKLVCFNCHHFRMEKLKTKKFVRILQLINGGDLEAVLKAVEELATTGKSGGRKAKKGETAKKEAKTEDDDGEDSEDDIIVSEEDMLRLRMSSNMNDFRNKIIHRFTHEQPTLNCGNCGAPRLPVARDGHAKIFMKRHGPAKMRSIWGTGARYPSVIHHRDAEGQHVTEQASINLDEDPVVKWLFYKEEENTAAYKQAAAAEESAAAAKKSAAAAAAAGKKSKAKVAAPVDVPEEPAEVNDRALAAATAKNLPANQRIMYPNEVQEHMRRLWMAETEIVPLIWSSLFKGPTGAKMRRSDSNIFFMTVLPVPPNRFRPLGAVNGLKSEHIQNTILTRVLNDSKALLEVVHPASAASAVKKTLSEAEVKMKAQHATIRGKSELWLSIQTAVNDLVDNTLSNKLKSGPARPPGIKQIIEKKAGLFRQNMMGKRVDFAARSVISPDPYIATTEIGVPLYFAKGLNYPEPVTDYNVEMLRQMVINGPTVHPGANAVEDEHGNVIPLKSDPKSRRGLAAMLQKPSLASLGGGNLHGVKKVYRHLIDGDVLIVNRQPTLHKPSMMVHKARVLGKENTIQMHYCNCNTYNADFDGDEMNLHLVQNEVARAEAHTIAINDMQYIVPKDGSPIRGLIQDHILSGVLLTQRDTFLNRDQFQQLLYYCCWDLHPQSPMIVMPPPAILKPVPLWTGKQVITAMLDNLLYKLEPLNLTAKCAVPEEMWGKGSNEGILIIRGNHLLTGSLGKNQFGAKPHGLVHSVYELYGPSFSASLLTVLGRLLTHWLQFIGFTCGMDDTLLHASTERDRAAIRVASDKCGLRQAGIFLGLFKPETADSLEPITEEEQAYIYDKLKQMSESAEEWDKWDKHMIGAASKTTSKIIDTCLPKGQIKPFPKNNLGLMTVSGAKGSRVNFSQISCLLGQQELEGKRVPLMVTGRSLPSFLPFDPSPRAGGYVTDRFLTGVRPQEYFFHCMAGREGLIDTAVKTSRSGYLQRCIVKHLESLVVQYDHTVRDASDGSVLQFRYGEDSVDVVKSGFMEKFEFFAENLDALLQAYDFAQAEAKLKRIPKKETKAIQKALSEQKRIKTEAKERVTHAVTQLGIGIEKLPVHIQETVNAPDPVMATYWPGATLGCISEKYEAALEGFIRSNPQYFLPESSSSSHRKGSSAMDADSKPAISKMTGRPLIDADLFRNAMYVKYIHCLAEAGEAVGVIAGQSIGEPSTQMTLNTFHLAGKGDVNVTLGIPRLKELIQTVGSIKTPSVTMPLHPHCTEKDAQRLANRLYRLSMAELIERLQVTETLTSNGNNHARQYDVVVELKPFEKKWEITWAKLRSKTTGFVATLLNEIAKMFRMKRFFAGKDTMGFNWDSLGEVIGGLEDDDHDVGGSKRQADDDNDDNAPIDVVKGNKEEEEDMPSDDDDGDSVSSSSESDEDKSSDEEAETEDESEEGAKANSSDDEEDGDVPTTAVKVKSAAAMDVDEINASWAQKSKKTIVAPTVITNPKAKDAPNIPKKDKSSEEAYAFLAGQSSYITAYHFDEGKHRFDLQLSIPADKAKLLLVSLIERLAEKFVIREVAGIVKAAVLKPDTKNPATRVITAGINFAHIHRLSKFVDVDQISTNDVQAVYRTYGIEAAREALRGEISAVFQAYGITVNPRHLTLVADYMTHTGEIRAMTRNGIATSASPFLKMTFESTTRFLASTSARGDYENMLGPSAALVLGLAPRVGSGLCDLRHNFAFTSDVQETM